MSEGIEFFEMWYFCRTLTAYVEHAMLMIGYCRKICSLKSFLFFFSAVIFSFCSGEGYAAIPISVPMEGLFLFNPFFLTLSLIGSFIHIFLAFWIFKDAAKYGMNRLNWFFLALFIGLWTLLFYLPARKMAAEQNFSDKDLS